MRKSLIITLAAVMTIGVAANVFAEDSAQATWSTTPGAPQTIGTKGVRPTLDIKPSTGVSLWVASTLNSYCAATKHQNGSKGYASSSVSTKIYMKDGVNGSTAGQNVDPPTLANAVAEVWTGWTAN
jgi:hypothetical protein